MPPFGRRAVGCRFSYLRADETAALGNVPVARCNRRAFPQKSESTLLHHVAANVISFAAIFYKNHRALILLRLLSKPDPLRWTSVWCAALRAAGLGLPFFLSEGG